MLSLRFHCKQPAMKLTINAVKEQQEMQPPESLLSEQNGRRSGGMVWSAVIQVHTSMVAGLFSLDRWSEGSVLRLMNIAKLYIVFVIKSYIKAGNRVY